MTPQPSQQLDRLRAKISAELDRAFADGEPSGYIEMLADWLDLEVVWSTGELVPKTGKRSSDG